MRPQRTLALVALLLTGSLLTGCLTKFMAAEEEPPALTNTNETAPGTSTFENPDGSKSAAANETNKTVVGKGGIEHLHDYWSGADSITIIDQGVSLGMPYFCDNRDTSKPGCAVIRPPVTDPATLVFEGTGRMTITVSNVAPNVMGLEMSYKNGANPVWSAPVAVTPDTPIELELSAIESDMPHASASQWAWRFVGKPAIVYGNPVGPDFHVTITIHKSGKVVHWPGHPDFYADKPYRVVMEKAGVTRNAGIHDQWVYGDEANVIRPDLLVSSGTGNLTLYLNITSAKMNGVDMVPDVFYIDYTNATGYWRGDYTEWNPAVNRLIGEKISPTEYIMRMPVKYTGWDSPYAPVSGWQFIVRPGYYVPGVVWLSPQTFPYEVEFHLTIIATPDPQYTGDAGLRG